MNYYFGIVLMLTTIMTLALAVPGGLKEENVPIFVNLLVQNLLQSSNCHQERKKEVKYPCIATVQMGQLDKHGSLKRDLEVLSEGKPLWDANMTRGTNISARTVRRDLIKNVLEKVDLEMELIVTDTSKIPTCKDKGKPAVASGHLPSPNIKFGIKTQGQTMVKQSNVNNGDVEQPAAAAAVDHGLQKVVIGKNPLQLESPTFTHSNAQEQNAKNGHAKQGRLVELNDQTKFNYVKETVAAAANGFASPPKRTYEEVWSAGMSRKATNIDRRGNGTIPAANEGQSINKTPIEPAKEKAVQNGMPVVNGNKEKKAKERHEFSNELLVNSGLVNEEVKKPIEPTRVAMPKDLITKNGYNSSVPGEHSSASGKKKEESPSSGVPSPTGLSPLAEEVSLIKSGRAIRKSISFTIDKSKLEERYMTAQSDPIRVLGFDWFVKAQRSDLYDIKFIPSVLNPKEKPPIINVLTLVLDAKRPNGYTSQSYNIQAYGRFSILNALPEKNLAHTRIGHVFNGPRLTLMHGERTGHQSELEYLNMAEVKYLLDPANGFLNTADSMELQVDFTIISSTLDHLSLPQFGDANTLVHQEAAFPEYEHHILLAIDKCKELFTREYFTRSASALKPLNGFNWSLAATTEHKGFLSLRLRATPPEHLKTADYHILVDYRITILNATDGNDFVYKKDGEEFVFNKNAGPEHAYIAEFDTLLNPESGFVRYDDFIEVAVDFTIKSFKVSPILPTNEVAPMQQNAIIENVDLTNNGAYDEHIRMCIYGNELGGKYLGKKSHSINSLAFFWYLYALKTNKGFLRLELKVETPYLFIENPHMEVHYRIALLKTRGQNLVKEGNEEIGFKKDANRLGYITIELQTDLCYLDVAKIEDLLVPTKGFLHNGSMVVEADFSITYSLLLVIEDCERLFEKQSKFTRSSLLLYSAPSPDQFNWQLEATGEKGFLAVFLHAKQPTDYKGKYRIVIDYRLYLLNVNNDKHRINEKHGQVCTDEHNTGWGDSKLATFEDLLDKAKGFLHPNGSIEVLAKFSIKSFEMDPIPIT